MNSSEPSSQSAVQPTPLLPLVLAVGIYIFLRGHNQPGGGFIAALVVAIAFLLQYLASGFDWTDARRKVGEHLLIASGVLVAMATGLGSLLFGAMNADCETCTCEFFS